MVVGSHGVTQHAGDAVQSSGVDAAALAKFAETVAQALPALALSTADQQAAQTLTGQIVNEASEPRPDRRRLKALGGSRVVTAGGGRLRLWDPGAAQRGTVELGGDTVGSGGGGAAGRPGGHRRQRPAVGVGSGGAGDRPGQLGRDDSGVNAVAALPDGRVVTGSGGHLGGGRVMVWDPAEPGAGPVELGRDDGGVNAVAALPDGRVVSGGGHLGHGRVLVWDPAEPGAGPVELGRDDSGVNAVAALPDGRVVGGGLRRPGVAVERAE